jgi:hypothetical protein
MVSREQEGEKIMPDGALGANISTGAIYHSSPKRPILSISLAFQTEAGLEGGRKRVDFRKSFK